MDVSGCNSYDYISEITLECLMNKDQYGKYLVQKNPTVKNNNKKDKKFYRRRIFDLTKQLINNENPEFLMPDVRFAFDNYVNSCINYFKILDKTDILQEDYTGLDNIDIKNEINIDNIGSTDEANQLIMRSIKITYPPTLLDNFVTIKNAKELPQPIIPKQKEINLKDPNLKNKGIRKKKNITNNYDNNIEKEETNEKIKNT
jgi:hypothetical protein